MLTVDLVPDAALLPTTFRSKPSLNGLNSSPPSVEILVRVEHRHPEVAMAHLSLPVHRSHADAIG